MRRPVPLAAALLIVASVAPQISHAGSPVVDPTVPAARDAEAVVLTGKDFPGWAVPANFTAKLPLTDLTGDPVTGEPAPGSGCTSFDSQCLHNHYAKPDFDSNDYAPQKGVPTNRLLGYRWNPKSHKFQQIPFQVDQAFTRYLDNSASGFSVYSGQDQHTTYAYDREGWRMYGQDPNDPCHAVAADGIKTTPDPVRGLDTNDELAFMASDAGPQAPSSASLPKGIFGAREVKVADPSNPGAVKSVYVMRASAKGPKPAFNASNGYVRYMRDSGADTYMYSQSSYDGYGNARIGRFYDAAHGGCVGGDASLARTPQCTQKNGDPVQNPGDANVAGDTEAFWNCPQRRRPADTTTITTPRYRFRYDGRWLMTDVRIAPHDDWSYGPDLVDRWKARAFAQDPGSKTPCCGYEEEDTNWGGSSILLRARVGPVRAIRETWGADSGTNVIRRETFYRDEMVQKNWLRVHVIPPLDGIYAQWDFNAGRVNRFYNAQHADGVPIDGRNDEVYGNFDDPCSERWDADDSRSDLDTAYRQFYRQSGGCDAAKALEQLPEGDYYHQSMDPGDLTFGDTNAALGWSEISGPNGTIVDRIKAAPADATPGGAAQSVAAMPYYRDDACFDDGTGSDPGPELHPRHFDQEEASTASDGSPRRCWDSRKDAKVPAGDDRFWQGDIGTHGLHLLFLAESDNARLTVPVTEIVSEWQMVMLKGDPGNVGERYGRSFEKPLIPLVQ